MADYRALYRKWRPTDFDDVVGQKGITDILKYEVACGKTSHAYLFCGSRGTGKTSCAKILAKAVNCLHPKDGNPCNACEACRAIDAGIATDVIEMDAASNNSVGDVRDMKDEINFTPAELKYRVYIIDEVHMMSGSAFNALLKTLEEPPAYVIFILATTELHKLPTTIISRCQRFDFRRMTTPVAVGRLMKIAAAEGIDLTEDGARVIARAAAGGMRDSISLLELCAGARQKITAEFVSQTVGTGNRDKAYQMAEAISARDYTAIFRLVSDIVMTGSDFSVFWQELICAYRDIAVCKSIPDAAGYLDLSDGEYERLKAVSERFTPAKLFYHNEVMQTALARMQRAGESSRSIAEIALAEMCDPKTSSLPEALALRVENLEKELSRVRYAPEASPRNDDIPAEKNTVLPKESSTSVPESPAPSKETPQTAAEPAEAQLPYGSWGRVVRAVGEIKASLASPLAKATVLVSAGNRFLIKLPGFFAAKIAGNPADTALITGTIADTEGKDRSEISVEITEQKSGDVRTFSEEIGDALGN